VDKLLGRAYFLPASPAAAASRPCLGA